MLKKNVLVAALLLFVTVSPKSFAAIITTIGSASVVQGSSGGFFNVPISINSDSGPVKMGAYLVEYTVFGRPSSLSVFNENVNNATLFNTPGLIGFNNFDPTSSYSSNGTTATFTLLGLAGPINEPPENFGIDVSTTGGILGFLPVSTNLPIGTYQLTGLVTGIQNSGTPNQGGAVDIDGPVIAGSFTVTAVPEPSVVALIGMVAISGMAIQRLRRFRIAATN